MRGTRSLDFNLAEIVRIDKELRALVRSPIVYLQDITKQYRALREERRGHVRIIQNYRPREAL